MEKELILQQFVSTSKGRDLRVMIAGGAAVDCATRTAAADDGFKANASAGGSMVNYPMTERIAELANAAAKGGPPPTVSGFPGLEQVACFL